MTDFRPTLLIIDVQQAFDDPAWGQRNNLAAEERVMSLISGWRRWQAPIVHVRHRSSGPGGLFRGSGFEFKDAARPAPGETVIEKSVHSAFIGTDLEQRLRQASVSSIVIAGFTTDHCCSTTARMGADLGFEVLVTCDATATFARTGLDGRRFTAEEMHESALTSLSGEFAEIVSTANVIERLDAAMTDAVNG